MKSDRKISRREMLKITAAAGAVAATGVGLPRLSRGEEGDEQSLPQVPRAILGKTGASVPILLFGAGMKLDPRFDPKLAEAYRFGVNYIDAADCYGGETCEPAVASFLERAKIAREDVWITSKSDQHDPKGFAETLDRSLERLKVDYVDMYFLHAVQDEGVFTEDLRKVVEEAKASGKIKHFGFSCHDGNVAELLHLAAETPWVETVMFRYNFRKYGDEKLNAAIDAASAANVGLIAMKTQGSEASFADAWQKFEGTGKWNKHQAVLKAVWEDKRIHAAVSHMDTFEKLKENIAAALDNQDLGQADHEALEQYAMATRMYACDGCDHICNAAVKAPVAIGATMRAVMYHDVYGEPEKATEAFGRLPAEARMLRDVDFAPANAACPHGVDVAAHMQRATEILRA
jgi:predicted aldo/keto reductase-like oxidoreductase